MHGPACKIACIAAFLNRPTVRVGAQDESGVIKDNYTEEIQREEIKAKKSKSDLHWIGGVPVDVRQAGTGGLPRKGLHHGQQKEK